VHGAAMMGGYIRQSKLLNETFDCDYINLQTTKRLNETGKGIFSKTFTILGLYLKVMKALIKNRYDLCYISTTASGPGFYKDFVVIAIMKLFGKKILHHFQNKGVSTADSWMPRKLYSYIFKNTKSILLSPYLYDDIKKYVAESDVYYCANAGTGLVKKHTDTELHLNTKKTGSCRFLYLSNMIIQKGVYTLLDACKILSSKGVDFECHFVGGWTDISEKEFIEKIKLFGLEDSVWAHGPKYDQEKLDFFKNSDVFVFPTFYHYEAFPLVILEAMQHSLPVISTPEGGIRESVIEGETGFLTPQQDALELCGKMELLIKDFDLRITLGNAGKNRYERLFTLEAFEQRMHDIIDQVILDHKQNER